MVARVTAAFALVLLVLGASVWYLGRHAYLPFELPAWVPGIGTRALPEVSERRISVQRQYALALKPDQRLYGWGNFDNGRPAPKPRKGNKTPPAKITVPAPMALDADTNHWRYITAGGETAYTINADGQLWRGPLQTWVTRGDSSAAHKPVFGHLHWSKVHAAAGMTMGLTADGRLHVWREQELAEGKICFGFGDSGICIPLDSSGRPLHMSNARLEAMDADLQTRTDIGLRLKLAEKWRYWEKQPGGIHSPRAKKAMAKEKAINKRKRDEVAGFIKRRHRTYVEARQVDVPLQVSTRMDWTDFCLARTAAGPEEAALGFALDGTGALWQIRVSSGNRYFYQHPEVSSQPLATGTRFARVYCSEFSPTVHVLDTERQLWRFASGHPPGLSPERAGLRDDQPGNALQQISAQHWTSVAPGQGFAIGLASNGSLWAWGERYDEVTHGHSEAAQGPVLIDAEYEWVEVDATNEYMLARTAQGQLYTWGINKFGRLGDGNVAQYRERPEPVIEPVSTVSLAR